MATVIKRRKTGAAEPPMGGRGSAAAVSETLALVHTTALGNVREIVSTPGGMLNARRCPVFELDLVYFFLGRPAYRLRGGDAKAEHISMFPAALIVDPAALPAPYHVYPLDTGGLMNGVFGDRPDPHVFLEDYELKPATLEAARAHIDWAFGSNADYYDGNLKPGLAAGLEAWDEVGRAFLTVAGLAVPGSNQLDKRASAIEVAYRDPVSLKSGVKVAVLPRQYLESPRGRNDAFLKKLADNDVDVLTYDWNSANTPNEHCIEIERIVREYLEDKL